MVIETPFSLDYVRRLTILKSRGRTYLFVLFQYELLYSTKTATDRPGSKLDTGSNDERDDLGKRGLDESGEW